MSSRPASAWIVVAAWFGLMVGVGIAIRPAPVEALVAEQASEQSEAWQPFLERAAGERPRLWVGDAPCPCDGGASARLMAWAGEAGLEVLSAPGRAGVALADRDGQLRYAGEAAALVLHCGGLRGFRAWWETPSDRPVFTAACLCT